MSASIVPLSSTIAGPEITNPLVFADANRRNEQMKSIVFMKNVYIAIAVFGSAYAVASEFIYDEDATGRVVCNREGVLHDMRAAMKKDGLSPISKIDYDSVENGSISLDKADLYSYFTASLEANCKIEEYHGE